jgi:hypothetical protein
MTYETIEEKIKELEKAIAQEKKVLESRRGKQQKRAVQKEIEYLTSTLAYWKAREKEGWEKHNG